MKVQDIYIYTHTHTHIHTYTPHIYTVIYTHTHRVNRCEYIQWKQQNKGLSD